MGFAQLKSEVRRANQEIVQAGLVLLTWGNVSGVDRDRKVMAIKPSGVDYGQLTHDDIVVLSLEDGSVVEGSLRPSSDTPTHLALYQIFSGIGGIVHTHSTHATSWAQAGKAIPCLGTTHADHFQGAIPVTRPLERGEIESDYEYNTGKVIVECLQSAQLDPGQMPAVLVWGHGPFVWGASIQEAVENARVLEVVAYSALQTLLLNPSLEGIDPVLLDKHFLRKQGPDAYYGQKL